MRVSSWSGWKSRMWTKSRELHQRWPSGRKIRRETRVRPVATSTEIYDYLRLLFARCGQTFCIKCGSEVRRDSPDEIANRILRAGSGRRFYVSIILRKWPTPKGTTTEKQHGEKESRGVPPARRVRAPLQELQKRGFQPPVPGWNVSTSSLRPNRCWMWNFAKPVYVLVDRLSVNPESRSRLVDSIEICYREGGGEAISGIFRGTRRGTRRSDDVQREVRVQE